MRTEAAFNPSLLLAFVLVLTRISAIFVFVPLPGKWSGAAPARAMLSMALTLAMFPRWPSADLVSAGLPSLAAMMFSEAALGITVGLAVAFLTEAITMSAQIVSIQAGFSYASIVDPTSGNDSSVLMVMANLISGMMFFLLGLDRQILYAFSRSLDVHPPGAFVITQWTTDQIIHLGATVFSVGFRLVLPLVALLALVDISLALLSRINSQLQLMNLMFPAKILASLGLLGALMVMLPKVFAQTAAETMNFVVAVLTK